MKTLWIILASAAGALMLEAEIRQEGWLPPTKRASAAKIN